MKKCGVCGAVLTFSTQDIKVGAEEPKKNYCSDKCRKTYLRKNKKGFYSGFNY
jgi:hypothetical protein